jgi:preprotein translocase SecF subunit
MGLYETDEGWSLKRAQESRDSSGRIAISFELGGRGPSLFGEVTRNNLNEPLAIVLDDQIISSANIESPIYGQGQITGVFTREYVNYIVRTLEAGALPAKLKETPLQQRSVAPTLGVTNQQRGLHAVTIAFVATIIFMAIYYGYNGVIADIALLMNLVITLGVMSFIQATFTLPGVAGLVLMLGMAVDANVLIYERIREELQRGVSVRMAVKLGYEKAFSAILDSNVTTILTAVILGSIGSEEIKGFGLTLGIGLVTSMFTALFVTRQFFHTMTPESLNKEEVRRVSVGTVVLVAAAAIIMGSGYLAVDPDFRADSAWFGLGEFISWMAGTAVVLVLALVVFRLVYGATGHRRANKLPMLRLFSAPKIQWMSKYRIFWTVSAVILILGFVFEAAVPSAQYLDIEFVGGTSVQVEVDDQHEAMFEEAGDQRLLSYIANEDRTENDPSTSVEWLESAAAAIEKVEVESAGELSYRVEIPGDYTPAQTEALLMPSFEDAVRLGGIKPADEGGITLTMKTGTEDNPAPSLEDARKMVEAATEYARAAAGKLGAARVQAVSEELAGGEIRQAFEIVTTETHTSLVSQALLASMGDILEVTQPIDAQLVKPAGHPDGIVPVPQSAERLSDVLPADLVGSAGLAALDEFKGGVVFVFENLEPAQTENDIQVRLKDMRLQPDFEQLAARPTKAIGLVQADASAEAGDEQDEPLFSRMAIVVSDPQYMYVAGEENDSWRAELAQAELELAQTALASSQSLQRVTQFAPQIAQEATTKAVIAIVLSLIAIAAYLWVRFGSVQFGLAGIIALYHDVAITLSAVMACHYLHNTFIGELLGLQDFRIDLAMIAAFLTIVGYSINDSIVIFDRIRENRGRLATVSEGLINDSINQTLSRTLITSLTTLTAVVVMYVVGGEGIHGFAFAMIVGSISGTYSTIAIATPMLAHPRAMWVVATILATITILAILSAVPFPAVKLVLMAIVLAGAAWMLVKQLKATAGGATATAGA